MTEDMERNLRAEENYLAGLTDGKLEGKNEGIIEGIIEGKIAGKKENQTLIVKNLLNKNMSDLEIMEITNLNQKELENIKKELNN